MNTRRPFSQEFKIVAVELVTERGVAVAQAARDLDLVGQVLRRWMRELAQDLKDAAPGKEVMKPDRAEIEELGKELAGDAQTQGVAQELGRTRRHCKE